MRAVDGHALALGATLHGVALGVGRVDAVPAHVDLFAPLWAHHVYALAKRDLDLGLCRALVLLASVLGVRGGFPEEELVQRDAVEARKRDEVVGVGRGLAALPLAHGLATHAQLRGKRLLRVAGRLSPRDQTLCHLHVHVTSWVRTLRVVGPMLFWRRRTCHQLGIECGRQCATLGCNGWLRIILPADTLSWRTFW